MKKPKFRENSTFCTAFALLAIAVPGPATAQIAAFAAGEAANSVVDNLRTSLQQVLKQLDQSVSSGTFLTRVQVSNLLTEVDYHASGLEGKTFSDLDKQRRRASLSIRDRRRIPCNRWVIISPTMPTR